jgi:hypothetical protein
MEEGREGTCETRVYAGIFTVLFSVVLPEHNCSDPDHFGTHCFSSLVLFALLEEILSYVARSLLLGGELVVVFGEWGNEEHILA